MRAWTPIDTDLCSCKISRTEPGHQILMDLHFRQTSLGTSTFPTNAFQVVEAFRAEAVACTQQVRNEVSGSNADHIADLGPSEMDQTWSLEVCGHSWEEASVSSWVSEVLRV